MEFSSYLSKSCHYPRCQFKPINVIYLPAGTWTVPISHLNRPLKNHQVEENQPVATTFTVHILDMPVITPWSPAEKYSPPQLLTQEFDFKYSKLYA